VAQKEADERKANTVAFATAVTHMCIDKAIEVHGHLQCSVCGRVVESCCEGGSFRLPPEEDIENVIDF